MTDPTGRLKEARKQIGIAVDELQDLETVEDLEDVLAHLE